MPIFYSARERGFFDPHVHAVMPPDAVRITAKRHAELLSAQDAGCEIVPDARGRPVIRTPQADDIRAALQRDIKREAARRINAISPPWRQLNDLREPSEAGRARFVMIDMIRSASALIEAQLAEAAAAQLVRFPVREHPLWPQIDGEGD